MTLDICDGMDGSLHFPYHTGSVTMNTFSSVICYSNFSQAWLEGIINCIYASTNTSTMPGLSSLY